MDGLLKSNYGQNFHEQKYTFQSDLRKKFSRKDHIVAGVELSYIDATYKDSTYLTDYQRFITITNTTGVHYQQVSLNNNLAIEPRVSFKWSGI
ncbi:MAG: hypothetical protein KAR19_01980 [Bacteroidales bacterium]|nr:hypothetical protein [Bacteroidales bacterium]